MRRLSLLHHGTILRWWSGIALLSLRPCSWFGPGFRQGLDSVPGAFFSCSDLQAFITASRNYLEVVVWHSVVVIAPMFMVWSWFQARFRFSPGSVLLLFGLNGVLAELLMGGPALLMAPFWVL